MALSNQMEMFEDGGLKDEGGMTDEVSGNDVPSGSTREEVRDDIPAQLSEGEFVFPADVVRFLGLEKLMQLRQKAKMGLQKMESMGQMGNSEEATMPDDMPFDINDLDMEDEQEKSIDSEEEIEYNSGGVVKAAVGAFMGKPYNPDEQIDPVTGLKVNPVASYMPTNTRNLLGGSDASQLVGGIPQTNAYGLGSQAGMDSEMFESRRYVNSEGAVRFVNFNKATGQTTTNIKQLLDQGFVRKDEAIKEVAKTATPTPNYRPRPQEVDSGENTPPPGTSTKDQSFTDINISTLKSEELKEALSAVSIISQLGQFSSVIGLNTAFKGKNATARNMGAAIGGMLDNYRGGTVEFTSKGMNTNYNDNRSLNDLTQAEQDKLGKVAAATVAIAQVVFFDIDLKTKEKTARQQVDVIKSLDKYAKKFGIERSKKSITRYTREIFEKIADEEDARIVYNKSNLSKYKKGDLYDFDSQRARDNRMLVQRNEKAAQRPDSIFADPIESSYDPSDYNNEDGSSTNFGSGTNVGDDETSYVGDDPFMNKGGLAGKKKTPKPKKMKRGGLASR